MHCRAQGTTSTAVGVCHDYGAAVCHEGTLVAGRVKRGGPLLGGPGEVTARTIRCTTCAAARAA